MPIGGVNYQNSYRDFMSDYFKDDSEKTDSTEETSGKDFNAVFSDKKQQEISVQDFLTLMVAQLKNQDFMNPVDDTQYVTQLAQFATMQQMQDLAANSKANYVMSLIGKTVTVAKLSVAGDVNKVEGPIEKISLVNSEYKVYVDGKAYKLEEIMLVHQPKVEEPPKEDGDKDDTVDGDKDDETTEPPPDGANLNY